MRLFFGLDDTWPPPPKKKVQTPACLNKKNFRKTHPATRRISFHHLSENPPPFWKSPRIDNLVRKLFPAKRPSKWLRCSDKTSLRVGNRGSERFCQESMFSVEDGEIYLAILRLCPFFGIVKWPFQRLSDLQLADQQKSPGTSWYLFWVNPIFWLVRITL